MLLCFILFLTGCLIAELSYFRVASHFNIIDKPNLRSSHNYITIRGGGIIFPITYIAALPFAFSTTQLIFATALLLISILSFLDDLSGLNSKLRLIIQSIAVVLAILSARSGLYWPALVIIFIFCTGIINAYNFMDGINGITSMYSLVTIGSMFWINHFVIPVLPELFFTAMVAALLVFSFFNNRRRARCFAGDIGSVSMAFIICYMLLLLSLKTHTWIWILLLGIYGIDAGFTIFCRILRRERLMVAHRSHFYQYLANEAGWSHISVSLLYAGIQLLLNLMVIHAYRNDCQWIAIAALFVFLVIYSIFRLRFEGRHRLFNTYVTVKSTEHVQKD